jgi:transcriptional regulator with XRE-family HTH domain
MQNEFANLVVKYMKRERFTDSTLANRLRVKRETIFRWRKGGIRSPKYDTVIECADAFNLNPVERNEFFTSAGWPDPKAKLVLDTPSQDEYLVDNTQDEEVRDEPSVQMEEREEDNTNAPLLPITTRPIRDPRQFYGRKALLAKILGAWRTMPLEHVAIYGPKRSGKTSLLYYMMQKAGRLKQKYDWVFVDFDNVRMQQQERLLQYILGELKLDTSDCDLINFTMRIEDDLKKPAVIVMDNIKSGLQAPELDNAFWNNMRYLGNHVEKLGFCVASRYSLPQLAEETGKESPISNVFEEVVLGPLSEDEARTFLQNSSLPKKDASWILQQSQCWPVLLQELCKAQLDKKASGDWQKIGLAKVERYQYLWQSEFSTID